MGVLELAGLGVGKEEKAAGKEGVVNEADKPMNRALTMG